jgi:hypothetical protein
LRRRLIVLGVVLLVVGLGAAYWFTQVPGQIADDHRDRALPEHARAATAIQGVAATLTLRNFSAGNFRAANRARESGRFLRVYRRESRKRRRRLDRPRREIAAARQALGRLDRERLFEVESKPLLGGSGAVKDSEAIARRERTYLRAARAALDEYHEVVEYVTRLRRVDDRAAVVVARGFAEVPNRTVTDPRQLTVPLNRLARRLRPLRRSYLRLDAPAELRRERDLSARAITVLVEELRRASAAFSRFDNVGAERARIRLTRRLRRLGRGGLGSLARLVEGSSLRRRLDALDREDERIRRAYAAL